MKKNRKSLLCFVLSLVLIVEIFAPLTAYAGELELDSEQKNAIAMLNYITVLTQEINSSKNSRLYLEEAYSNLINNTYPNAVDGKTLRQMSGLLDIMESYRMIAVQRDRLQFIYEQNQAEALSAALPDPHSVMSLVLAPKDPVRLVTALANMAFDAYSSYSTYSEQNALSYLKEGWALDDDEAEVLHESRKNTFTYMISIVKEYGLPGELALTEKTVEEFVKWKNSTNNTGRIQFLESNKNTYQSFGGYWLTLAESYYKSGDYKKCLDAVKTYESMDVRIFRYDHELAKVLPMAIVAAEKTYNAKDYTTYAREKAQQIIDNTEHDSWALRYFAAQTLVDLYGKTKDKKDLNKAYSITMDNVNYLVARQQELNEGFLSKVKETPVRKGASKREKKVIEDYNKMLKEERKTEMAPVYEPLKLNCDLLNSLADELKVSASERKKIDGILHPDNAQIFLSDPLDAQYWFQNEGDVPSSKDVEIAYGGTVLILPVEYITTDAEITATVKEPGNGTSTVIADWKLDKVQRGDEGVLSSFEAAYTSKEAKKIEWKPNSTISVDIRPNKGIDLVYHFEFKTEGTKNGWRDYLKVWEGHKNNWYDYAKVWENSVKFVRVK